MLAIGLLADGTIKGLASVNVETGETATVELLPIPENRDVVLGLLAHRARPAASDTASTDADGRFRLAAPTPGVFRVTVAAEGFFPLRYFLLPLADPVELPPVALPRSRRARSRSGRSRCR